MDADSCGLGMRESAEDSEVFLKFLMRRLSLGEAPAAGTVLSRAGAQTGKYKLLNNSDISSLGPEGARCRRDTRGSTPSVASFRGQSCALPGC